MPRSIFRASGDFLLKYRWYLISTFISIVVGLLLNIDASTGQLMFSLSSPLAQQKLIASILIGQALTFIREFMLLIDRVKGLDTFMREMPDLMQKAAHHHETHLIAFLSEAKFEQSVYKVRTNLHDIPAINTYINQICNSMQRLANGTLHLRKESEVFDLDLQLLKEVISRKEKNPKKDFFFYATIYVDSLDEVIKSINSDPGYRNYLEEIIKAANQKIKVQRLFILRSQSDCESTELLKHIDELKKFEIEIGIIKAPPMSAVAARIEKINRRDIVVFDEFAASEGKDFFVIAADGNADYYFSGARENVNAKVLERKRNFESLWEKRERDNHPPADRRASAQPSPGSGVI